MLATQRVPTSRARLAAAGLALALAAAVPLHASVTIPATLDELTAEAELVVYARVAGVETRQAWHVLAEWGCDYAQGFYVASPRSAEELVTWLAGAWPAVA